MVNSDRDRLAGPDASGGTSPRDGPSANGAGQDATGPDLSSRAPGSRGDGLRLAELLAAQLCHEFSGSVGTLAGAVEIARTCRGSVAEALGIAAEAAAGLVVRLRLLRAAWADAAEALDIAMLRTLCDGLPRQVRADFGGLPAERCFPPAPARVLLNVLLLAAESLPKGGAVILGETGSDSVLVVLRGQNAAWPPGLATWMADPATPWRAIATAAPHRLQGPLTALLAQVAGVRMTFALAADAEAAPPLLLRFP